MGLGFAAFGAELPELEARCHERLTYARPTVLAGPRTRRGRRLIIYYHGPGPAEAVEAHGGVVSATNESRHHCHWPLQTKPHNTGVSSELIL